MSSSAKAEDLGKVERAADIRRAVQTEMIFSRKPWRAIGQHAAISAVFISGYGALRLLIVRTVKIKGEQGFWVGTSFRSGSFMNSVVLPKKY
jgi:hypothetical protein